MAHIRTQIRDAAVVLVDTVSDLTVSKSRVHNFRTADLPAAAIYSLTEISPPVPLNRTQERVLRLVIDIHARSIVDVDVDIDTELDDLCVLVEKAMASDFRFGPLAQSSFLMETTIGLTGEGDARHGLARLEYEVKYRTAPNAPDV